MQPEENVTLRISFACYTGEEMASTRYRILIPARELAARGYEVSVGLPNSPADITLFSKHFNASDPELARNAQGLVVFDVCDDHFETEYREHYLRMVEASDVITCSTETMAERIFDVTGRKAHIIYDPFDLPEGEARFEPEDPPRLLWFGHQSNLDSLERVLPEIDGFPLTIVTGQQVQIHRLGETHLRLWSREVLVRELDACDIVIIPTLENNPRKRVKSHNRMLESLRRGRFVVAGPVPAYERFKRWMHIGNIREGIDAALEKPESIQRRIRATQRYVRIHFSPSQIADRWEQILCRNRFG